MRAKGPAKITLFLPSLIGGGAEKIMVNLARGFSERGHKVDLALVNAVGPFIKDIPDTVRLVDCGAKRIISSLPKLVNYLRQVKPDVMLSTLEPTNIIAVWARFLSRESFKLYLRMENTYSIELKNITQLKGRIIWKLAPVFYPCADGLITLSQGVADDFKNYVSLADDRIAVINSPVDIEDIKSKALLPIEHPWFKEGELPVILGIGRLAKQKDFPTLIRAFELLRKTKPARLVILGEGEERSVLENLVHESGLNNDVDMPGFVDNPYAYLSRASVFVLSSAWEGLSVVTIESLAVGTPIVSTDCPHGPSEVLDSGRYGKLVPVGDSPSMAEAILKTMSDRPEKSYLQYQSQKYSFDIKVNEYLKILLQ